MEKKGKIIASLGAIVVGVIIIIVVFSLFRWLVQGLIFGVGGFIIGLVLGFIWKGKIMKKKAQVSTEK